MTLSAKLKKKLLKYTSRLICICISAFFVASCEKPNDLGLDLQNQNELIGTTFTDTISITSENVLLGGLESHKVVVLTTGAYDDSFFGDIAARTYSEIHLSSDEPDFGTNPQCDSIKLTLVYNGYFYGDTLETQTLEVYELTESLDPDSAYKTTDAITIGATAIGTFTGTLHPRSNDELEIDLSAAFGDAIISAAQGVDNDDFITTIKGISIRPMAGNYSGAVAGFSLSATNTEIKVYYHNDSDTLTYDIDLDGNVSRFNSFIADRSATQIAALVNEGDAINTSSTNNEGYLQAGTGIITKLSFPNLDEFISAAGNVSINRAELVLVPVDGASAGDHEDLPTFITVYESNVSNGILQEDGSDVVISADEFFQSSSGSISEFIYDADEERYVMDITWYVDALVRGERDNNGLLVTPTINSTRISRLKFYDNESPANTEQALKLNVYLTKLN